MKTYRATIYHHSIARARIVDLNTSDLRTAKRRAFKEFSGEQSEYVICILGDETVHSPRGIVATRCSGYGRWTSPDL